MRRIDYRYIIKADLKYLLARLKNGGRMKDYFRVKRQMEARYLNAMDLLQDPGDPGDEDVYIRACKELMECRKEVCKYADMVTWDSWKKYKDSEKERLMRKIMEDKRVEKLFPDEVSYLRQSGRLEFLPYQFRESYVDKIDNVKVFKYDKELKYVLHNGKRLFFPNEPDIEIQKKYIQLIMEQDHLSPHRYFDNGLVPQKGCIFVDVGAAEGIVTLDHVDIASEVYILECSDKWINALHHTFEPWGDKIHIIKKFAGIRSDNETISLDKLLDPYAGLPVTIKMDIEGMELEALLGAKKTLKRNFCTVSCATYHTNTMYKKIKDFLMV